MEITDKTQIPIPSTWKVRTEGDLVIIEIPHSAIDREIVEQLELEGASVAQDLPSGDLTIVL